MATVYVVIAGYETGEEDREQATAVCATETIANALKAEMEESYDFADVFSTIVYE